MFRKQVAVFFLCFGAIAGPAHSQVVLLDQKRSVEATLNGAMMKEESPGFGPFQIKLCNTACAEQDSSLNPTIVQATGIGAGTPLTNGNWCHAESNFQLVFQVNRKVPFSLSGFVKQYSSETTTAAVALSGPNLALSFSATASKPFVSIGEIGELTPGQYTLTAKAHGHGSKPSPFSQGWSTGQFGFVLDIGELCFPDCDLSGSLNIDDFVCFQTRYAVSDLKADCTADGALTIDDFICFQTAFAVGC